MLPCRMHKHLVLTRSLSATKIRCWRTTKFMKMPRLRHIRRLRRGLMGVAASGRGILRETCPAATCEVAISAGRFNSRLALGLGWEPCWG
jgi:hypothetical protein